MNTRHAHKKEIDFELLDNLIAIFCTGEECAGVLEVDYETLNERIKDKYDISFQEYFKQKNSKGKASLRRKQFKMAEKHPVMAIFLGKQYLGQADKQIVKAEFEGDVKFTERFKEYSNKLVQRLNIPMP